MSSNVQRYFLGIGRYTPDAAYARGIADLEVLNQFLSDTTYMHS